MNFLSAPPKVLNRFGKSLMIVAWSCSNFYIFSFLVLSSFYHYYCWFFTVEIQKLIGKFQQMFTTNNIISGCDGRLFPHPKLDGIFRLMDGRGTICPPSFRILGTLIRILWEFWWLQCNLHDLTKKMRYHSLKSNLIYAGLGSVKYYVG